MDAKGLNAKRVWLFYLILAVVLLAFQELLFRYVFPIPEVSNFNRINYSRMIADVPAGKVQPLSNEAFTWASAPDGAEFVHHLNLYGFRDANWPVNGGQRVMFIGDSFLEGFMAGDDETIPRGFETASADHGDPIDTINLGTGASGIDDYLAVIGDGVPIFRPDTVILVLYANDFADNKTSGGSLIEVTLPIHSNPYLPRLYVVISKLTGGDKVATRWLKKPFLFLPTAQSKRSPLHDDAFVEHVSGFVSPGILSAMQQGMFNPFVINEYSNYKAYLQRSMNLTGVIESVKNFVEAHSSRLMVVYIPYKGQVSDYYLDYVEQFDEDKEPTSLMSETYQTHASSIRAECERFDIPFLDMTAILRQREAKGERMYWDFDEHMKASSYLMTGAQIYEFWRDSESVAGKR